MSETKKKKWELQIGPFIQLNEKGSPYIAKFNKKGVPWIDQYGKVYLLYEKDKDGEYKLEYPRDVFDNDSLECIAEKIAGGPIRITAFWHSPSKSFNEMFFRKKEEE